MPVPLLDARDNEVLSSLSLSVRKRIAGLAAGERRSPAAGGGIEFADYREYAPGEDARGIDWTVFLRLRKTLVKVRAEEKELSLIVLLDASASMEFGSPSKLLFAKRVVGALAAIAIKGGDRAGVCLMGPSLQVILRPERGKTSLEAALRALEGARPVADVRPKDCAYQFAARYGRKCLAVLVSDLLFEDWPELLAAFAASGCEAHVLQVIAPEELDPEERGEATLVDSEDGSEAPVHFDAAAQSRYASEMSLFLGEARARCGKLGLGYALLGSDLSLDRALRGALREEGLVC